MIALLTNTSTGQSFIRLNASVKESGAYQKLIAKDESDLVSKAIKEYISNEFNSSVEPLNLALSLALSRNERATMETLRKMYDEIGEVIKVALDDSDYPKLSKRLVSKSDKEFARTVSRKKETNDDGDYESYYQLLKNRI